MSYVNSSFVNASAGDGELTLMMTDHKHSHVWFSLTLQNSNNTVLDMCGRAARVCDKNTTDLMRLMRFNHNAEYEECSSCSLKTKRRILLIVPRGDRLQLRGLLALTGI